MQMFKLYSRARYVAIGTLALVLVLGVAQLIPDQQASGGWIYVKESPNVTVSPAVVTLKKGAKVTIAGSGYEKGQELGIRLVMGGVVSDIRHQVKPEPNVNEHGAFYSEWVLANEYRLLPEGAMTLSIVNDDGEVLAHTPIVWLKEAKKDAKKKK